LLYINLLLTELFGWDRLQSDKGLKFKLNVVFPTQIKVRRLIAFRPGLRDQDPLSMFKSRSSFRNLVFYHMRSGYILAKLRIYAKN
jgi:hypothetical protein